MQHIPHHSRSNGRQRRLAAAVVVGLVVIAACGNDSKDTKAASPATSAKPTTTTTTAVVDVHGPFAVGTHTETFVDSSRPTAATGDAPEAPARTIETVIFYPADGTAGGADVVDATPAPGKHPLVVFAHGLGGATSDNQMFLHAWAAAGFVVAAPLLPLTRADAPNGGVNPGDFPNEPGDVSFVITKVLGLPSGAKSLRSIIDPDAVAVAGRTLGAGVALADGFNSCCFDDRVKAVVALAVGELPCPNGAFFGGTTAPPLLVVAGDADQGTPYAVSQQTFTDAKAPKWLVTLTGASGPPFEGKWQPIAITSTIDFLHGVLRHEDASLTKLDSDANVAGSSSLEHQ